MVLSMVNGVSRLGWFRGWSGLCGVGWRRALLALLLGAGLAPAAFAQRVALLVGNASYSSAPLRNPPNDVREMEAALTAVGFKVSKVLNANQSQLKRAVRDFGNSARGADMALLYYSGHGTQVRGENYLIPVGASIEKESDYEIEAVSANAVLAQLREAQPRAAVVVLDACRDNPHVASTKSLTKGLARMDAPTGTMIAFATAPNDVAQDSGLYARVLAKNIRRPGLELLDVFRDTSSEVRRQSGGQQVPRVSEVSIDQRIYLAGPGAAAPVGAQGGGTQVASVVPEPLQTPPLGSAPAPQQSQPQWSSSVAAFDSNAAFPGGSVIKIVVPYPAGLPIDALARLFASELSTNLGTPVLVENRAGAGGTMGMAQVSGSEPNGLTLLVHHTGMATVEAMYRSLPAGSRTSSFEPIGLFSESPMILVGRPDLDIGNRPDVAAWLKGESRRFKFLTSSPGSASDLCAMALESALRLKVNRIRYKGTVPALTDLMASNGDLMCTESSNDLSTSIGSGKVKGLGVVSLAAPPPSSMSSSLPRLPLDPSGQLSVWSGLYAPKGTPNSVIVRLSQALQAATRSQRFVAGLASLGVVPVTDGRNTPAGLRQFLASETGRLGEFIRASGTFAD